jgi:hypothetical protein
MRFSLCPLPLTLGNLLLDRLRNRAVLGGREVLAQFVFVVLGLEQ